MIVITCDANACLDIPKLIGHQPNYEILFGLVSHNLFQISHAVGHRFTCIVPAEVSCISAPLLFYYFEFPLDSWSWPGIVDTCWGPLWWTESQVSFLLTVSSVKSWDAFQIQTDLDGLISCKLCENTLLWCSSGEICSVRWHWVCRDDLAQTGDCGCYPEGVFLASSMLSGTILLMRMLMK